ncbi:hypothetical protein CH251_21590 [Rhodococcus sp. 06-462-5]|uniref:hypothetical protein n=1 Tax=unclassified Rhodococcus (in: high G+C Gram-positive bacteria) TaxID=192944 RepID=UPI000B9C5F99|nr:MULTISPECIES: hypothetical protein [unclassified Rhodococcus (in: high G+C Gram-positive bacteria)]OZC67252.1 hypothetical protein CH251_21590 [Rhodococcus sp. 06-462-5]OZE65172.1 hypothetical protein CH270_14255 [Rhodococcus sp. 02-925g]
MLKALAKTPTSMGDSRDEGVLVALSAIAQRVHFLDAQITDLTTRLDVLVIATNPGLRTAHGIGPDCRSVVDHSWLAP